MSAAGKPVHQQHLELTETIEARFEVASWRSGDIALWPPARMDLFLDMFRAEGRDTAPPPAGPVARVAGGLARPLANAWKSRRDLDHWLPWPIAADAIVLGDGVSLDMVDGAWRDRHAEPVIAALERQGRSTFLMQPGGLTRLPWARRTFAANTIAARGAMAAALGRPRPIELPDWAAVVELLARAGVQAPSLDPARLARRARAIAASASRFQRILRVVRPRLAFVVTYYAGLGHAFALACRREGVLCVDMQHAPREDGHRAYRWRRLPAYGYSTVPAVFWTWTSEDARQIQAWADEVRPWHSAVVGGHAQLAPFLDDQDADTRRWDERFAALGGTSSFDREILVALQPIGGRRAVWETLARQIEESPTSWRWWIRRHPASARAQDAEHQRLLALDRPNVVIAAASEIPLPALLRHMNVVVSLASGAAGEAAAFGTPALFLDPEAFGAFAGLIRRGEAEVVDVADVGRRIAGLPLRPARSAAPPPPPIAQTLRRLEGMADDYRRLARDAP